MKNKGLLLIAISLFLTVVTGSIAAYLIFSQSIESEFNVARNQIEIDSSSGLCIRNTGNDKVYIRVAVDVSDSEKSSKCVFDGLPGVDWETEYLTGSNGMYGYYYYSKPLEADDVTSKLFTGVTFSDSSVSGSDIKIYAESIPSTPYGDYEDAWNEYLY